MINLKCSSFHSCPSIREELSGNRFCGESHILVWYWRKGNDQTQEISSSLNRISKLDTEHNSSTEHLLTYGPTATFTFFFKFQPKIFYFCILQKSYHIREMVQ